MNKLVLWGAAATAALAGSAALAQAAGAPAPAPALRGAADVLNALILGALMGLFGQGLRAIAGFRTALDAASTQAPTQDDVFRAARLVVSLLVGALAGIAATFVVGLPEVAAAAGDPQMLLGLAAAGYAAADFLEGFFGQYFKGVAAPALKAQQSGTDGRREPDETTRPSDADLTDMRETVTELKSVLLASPALRHDGSPQEQFRAKAPGVMQRLIDDFALNAVQAAGVLGNIGHECLGFTKMQEIRPRGGRGGYGWCQWTGPRRRAFEAWARERGLDLDSDEANYGFLKHELETSEKATLPALKRARTLEEAVVAFLDKFERAGVRHVAARLEWAKRALDAFQ